MKKIVFLSRYVGTVDRGVETHVLELSKRLRNFYEVEIFSGEDADSFINIIRGKFDLVIPTNGRMQSFKAFLGKFFGRYKTLISGHAGIGRDDLWNILVTRPDVYIALTDFEKEWAKSWSKGTKIEKISNGVDLEKFSILGKKYDFGLKGPIILGVGALEWYKHHELTIKAVSRMPVGALVLVGKGTEREKLMNMGLKLLGKDRFKILSVSHEDIASVYRGANVFTMPSWDRESFGMVYVEAMSCGRAVVAPDDSPRREIVGKAGIFCDVYEPEAFAVALGKALDKNWGNLPRMQAEKYSWDKIAKEYKGVIDDLIGGIK